MQKKLLLCRVFPKLPSMAMHVVIVSKLLHETFIADVARELIIASVQWLMEVSPRSCGKCFVAKSALVFFLSSVTRTSELLGI